MTWLGDLRRCDLLDEPVAMQVVEDRRGSDMHRDSIAGARHMHVPERRGFLLSRLKVIGAHQQQCNIGDGNHNMQTGRPTVHVNVSKRDQACEDKRLLLSLLAPCEMSNRSVCQHGTAPHRTQKGLGALGARQASTRYFAHSAPSHYCSVRSRCDGSCVLVRRHDAHFALLQLRLRWGEASDASRTDGESENGCSGTRGRQNRTSRLMT